MRTWRNELAAFEQWRAAQTPGVLGVLEHLPDSEQQLIEQRGRMPQ